jgi:hypothetical protein
MAKANDPTTPIKDYIQSAVAQIKEAMPADARIDGIINIKLSTVFQKGKDGTIDLKVLNVGADVSEKQTQEITIPIRILTDTGLAVEEALKAEAESRTAKAVTDKKLEELKRAAIGTQSVQPSTGVRRADSFPSALPGLR